MFHSKKRMVLAALVLATFVASAAAADEPKKAAPPEPKIKVGDTAPDFKLKDQTGKEVALHDFRGKKSVALAFYVFAFTGG
jgi:cytochrome oxidase Cu insertion factor (SCO1/SenC/PrrC family)